MHSLATTPYETTKPSAVSPAVCVVEDDDDVRSALIWLLRSEGLATIAFASPREMLEAHDRERPGCILLDLRLPGMNGLELQRRIAEQGYCQPFIVLSGNGDVGMAVEAMKQGAVDFIEKPFQRQRLLDRVLEAIELDVERRRQLHDRDIIRNRLEHLSPRERQVLQGVVGGLLSKEIASQLGIATKTVEVHRSNIMRKMQVDSLAELVGTVTRHGLSN